MGASLQVNREIVSGMKYIQHTYRKGVKSEWGGAAPGGRRPPRGSRGIGRERGKAGLCSLTDALPAPAVDKTDYMVGSYGPRAEEYEFLTPMEEAPKGMLARGTYHNKSFFTDDDKHDHLTWEWNLSIKKDWTE